MTRSSGSTTKLMRARELIGRPVVTLGGDDVAQIKDVVYDARSGALDGFTLNGRGVFAGPLKTALAWPDVLACGADAVMIRDDGVLQDRKQVVERKDAADSDVLSSRVVTESGTDLGEVVDVIVTVETAADVVGYEIESSESLHNDRRRVLVPLPDTLAVSGEALVVPDAVTDFVSDDLAGFGAAVDSFRARLGKKS